MLGWLPRLAHILYCNKREKNIMPENKNKVELKNEEITKLKEITHKGKTSAREIIHANILLNTNELNPNKKKTREIAEILDI
jgi:hypothetical protein